ncbi:hypothetical protein SAMD00019534_079430 [Acytostelium subglobosum LB1]|uniref:hypothetical protein n=1 Tax=Acytostelium subglobosum LB1 TaxID=1410327 RepID=UPI000644BAF2|nr:hypothetical protein SAMD00019534_079430 [Acytostelium subglobosum LB1]GAM24768.1 hypothetical protein SAMD00019534_079430 [Acytostelium subglobosum LB1]|eukprot:XP_012752437.1 hypothetical protein SAMD00019534_079430 [Acytostelium subglobosum LB1]
MSNRHVHSLNQGCDVGNHSRRSYSSSSNSNNSTSTTTSTSSTTTSVYKDTYLNESFLRLSTLGPAFAVDSNNVEFIREPNDFYEQLIEGVKRCERRVVLSSLYLGTGKQEIRLVEELVAACKRHPNLQVHILLDGLRGTRKSPHDTDPTKHVSSATMLQPLLQQFPDRVVISMFHTPNLNGILKRVLPQRINEVIGVNHIKAYVFDDNLLISGANLSKDYFTNRQDRYAWVRSSSALAEYFSRVIGTIGDLSMKLDVSGHVRLPTGLLDPVSDSSAFKQHAQQRLSTLLQPNVFHPINDDGSACSPTNSLEASAICNNKTWIFPTIQMGLFNIRHDEQCTSYMFESVPPTSKLYITSPYFNLTKNYLRLLLSGKPAMDIITCSPETNGFYGAKGISGVIPDSYAIIERNFLQRVKDTHNSARIKVDEYIRSKWTYHAKGLWITAQGQAVPSVTMIGSPNFGSRSCEKDLEAQIILITEDPTLQRKMDDERAYLWTHTQPANLELFKSRSIPLWVRIGVYLFGNFL